MEQEGEFCHYDSLCIGCKHEIMTVIDGRCARCSRPIFIPHSGISAKYESYWYTIKGPLF